MATLASLWFCLVWHFPPIQFQSKPVETNLECTHVMCWSKAINQMTFLTSPSPPLFNVYILLDVLVYIVSLFWSVRGCAVFWRSCRTSRTLTTTIYSGISIFTWFYLYHEKKNEKKNVRVKKKMCLRDTEAAVNQHIARSILLQRNKVFKVISKSSKKIIFTVTSLKDSKRILK